MTSHAQVYFGREMEWGEGLPARTLQLTLVNLVRMDRRLHRTIVDVVEEELVIVSDPRS